MLPISDAGRYRGTFPFVNVALLTLNALVFLYEIGVGGFGFLFGGSSLDIYVFFLKYGFIPAELSSGQAFENLSLGRSGAVSIATSGPTWATLLSVCSYTAA